jgi:hypothetical protein
MILLGCDTPEDKEPKTMAVKSQKPNSKTERQTEIPEMVKDNTLMFTNGFGAKFTQTDFDKWQLSGTWTYEGSSLDTITFEVEDNKLVMRDKSLAYVGGLAAEPSQGDILVLSSGAQNSGPPAYFHLNLYLSSSGELQGYSQVFSGKMGPLNEVTLKRH